MNRPVRSSVTGLILAGGRARRMDGQDKGLLNVNGSSMVSRIALQLEPQCADLAINANRNIEEYAATGYPVYADIIADFQGPLAGMLTGLSHIDTEWMITAPCDGPYVSKDYVSRMCCEIEAGKQGLAVAYGDNRLQPVYALIHESLAMDLEKFLNTGDRKIDRWFSRHDYAVVDFSDSMEMFENINTPEQLEAVCQSLLKGSSS